nr:putative methyltransferase family protein [Tanacetum cinerariifolium]
MREGRLRWFGHVKRRPQTAPVRRVEALVVVDLRRMGRPKLRWEDKLKLDMNELLVSKDMTSNRNEWRARTRLGVSLLNHAQQEDHALQETFFHHTDFVVSSELAGDKKDFDNLKPFSVQCDKMSLASVRAYESFESSDPF